MTYPLVTIGIPTFNRADGFLREAFTSALNQTYPNIEIIVSDNCSTDNTEAVVGSVRDSRVRYYKHKTNIGAAKNFNFCVEQAEGVYFLMLHDDDLIDADFIDTCMKAAEYKTNIGIIRTGTRIIDANGVVSKESFNHAGGLTTEAFFMAWFESKTALYLCSTLFNTKRLREIGGFVSPYNLFQDVVAEVQLAAQWGRVDVEGIKASFRVHDEEITSTARIKEWCDDSSYLINVICNLVPGNNTFIRKEGTGFLARINYRFAAGKKTQFKRLLAYWVVFKSFKYRYMPPPIKKIMNRVRALKNKIFKQ